MAYKYDRRLGGDARMGATGTVVHVSKSGREIRLANSDRRWQAVGKWAPFKIVQVGDQVTVGTDRYGRVVYAHIC